MAAELLGSALPRHRVLFENSSKGGGINGYCLMPHSVTRMTTAGYFRVNPPREARAELEPVCGLKLRMSRGFTEVAGKHQEQAKTELGVKSKRGELFAQFGELLVQLEILAPSPCGQELKCVKGDPLAIYSLKDYCHGRFIISTRQLPRNLGFF
jgi:hypothetical protein